MSGTLKDRLREAAKFGSEITEAAPGINIEIRELSSGQRTAFGTAAQRAQKDTKSEDPFGPLYRKLLLATAHDPETGEYVWTEKNMSEIDELPGTLVERLGTVAFRVNGLDKNAKVDAKNGSKDEGTSTPSQSEQGISSEK
jgi:hypothetical protein